MERHHLLTEPEAERAVVGALLMSTLNGDAQCAATVFGALEASDIADAPLRALFAAAKRLHDRGDAMEPTLWLREVDGELPRDEAATLLTECGKCVATTATVGGYVRLVAHASRQRRLVYAANDALNAARTATHPIALDEAIDGLEMAAAELKRGSTRGADMLCAGDVEPQPIEWLWPGRIAVGKVTLLAGDPGLGKSLLTLDVAARVSRGAPWPDAPREPQSVGSVVLLSAEDDLADTIRPRLDAREANVSRVFALTSLADLGRDIDQLRSAIDRVGDCRLIVVDPVSAFMGRADSHVNAEVRAVLAPLAELAAEKRVAILAVTHLRKGKGAAMYRAMGSLAFVAAARAAWAVVKDKSDPKRRLLLAVKNNLAADVATGLAYTISPHGDGVAPIVCWEREPVTVTADEAMTPEPRKRGPSAEVCDEAAKWLRDKLARGPRLAKELFDDAEGNDGISKRTLQRAKKEIGVKTFRQNNPGPWWWRLPEADSQAYPQHKQPGDLGNVPELPGNLYVSGAQKSTSPSFSQVRSGSSMNGQLIRGTELLP